MQSCKIYSMKWCLPEKLDLEETDQGSRKCTFYLELAREFEWEHGWIFVLECDKYNFCDKHLQIQTKFDVGCHLTFLS